MTLPKKGNPTQRSPRSIIPSLRKRLADPSTSDRCAAYFVYVICQLEHKNILSFKEFFSRLELEQEDNNPAAEAFKKTDLFPKE